MNKLLIRSLWLITCLLTPPLAVNAQLKLPYLLSDGAVLQRDKEVKIWGWAKPNEKVQVILNGASATALSDEEGKWELTLPAMKAGGPYEMKVNGIADTLSVSEMYIGDVWICSGQSNMELTMARAAPMFPDEFERPANPQIRYFDVPDHYDFQEENSNTTGGSWISASPEVLEKFSAVAYFFGKKLEEKYDVPIGLINASVGGSPIQAWIRKAELRQFPEDYEEAVKFSNPAVITEIQENDRKRRESWDEELQGKDRREDAAGISFLAPEFSAEDWTLMEQVDFLPQQENVLPNGAYWFRKEIDISSPAQAPAKLLLGRMVDSDHVYFNGELVGSTSYQYPPRRYEVPASLIKKGKNVIVIRLVSERGRPGFVTDKPYSLQVGDQLYDLSREWKYLQTAEMRPKPGETFIRFKPLGLYQGMIAPLQWIPAKGVIWYQGESNAGNPEIYTQQMEALIGGWRKAWGQADLPFIFAQLPNFMEVVDTPVQEGWASLREAQRAALKIPNTGMAVTIDAGEANDIHPLDKETVGNRLAMQAMKIAYGEEGDFSSPMVKKASMSQDEILLTFENVEEGLMAKGEEGLNGFAVAGEDGIYHQADAYLKDNSVYLDSPVERPKTVRYAWANNPVKANLYGKNGLPASPFEVRISE